MQKLARSSDSEFLDSILKEAAKNKYVVMGDPGEGGAYHADSPEEAFAKWVGQESDRSDFDKIMKEMKEQNKEFKLEMKEISEGVWQYGNYSIKLLGVKKGSSLENN